MEIRRRWVVLAVGLMAALWAGSVRADEVVECEHAKLNTDDASTLDAGAFELGLSYGFTEARRAFTDHWARTGRGYSREEALGLELGYGLMEDLSIGLGIGYASLYDRDSDPMTAHGWGDLEVSAKWRFYHDEARRLEIAYTPALSLPTGEDEMTDDFFNLFNGIAISKDWGGPWTSNFDLGYSYPIGGHRDDYRGTLSANAALGYQLTDWAQPEIELNYAHDFMHGDDADLLAVTCGCILCVHENVRLDVGVQQALTGRNADRSTALLAALTFGF